ncbi:MAG TPA: riboflavin kinase [Actinoplanes sp.]|nr:riboflavin kinase [Actinoplanes sp.]
MIIAGEVVHGAGRGRPMGFPTANLDVTDPGALPEDGVYFGWFTLGERTDTALVSVGTNPTFGSGARHVEVFVLDRDEDMYGRTARVEIVTLVRRQVRFGDAGALIGAMRTDEGFARRLAAGETVEELPWSP